MVGGLFIVANLLMKARYPPVRRDADGKKTPHLSPVKLMKEPRYALTVLGTTLICLGVFFPLAYIQGGWLRCSPFDTQLTSAE